jgi:Protein of unknown function (DUF1360)
MTGPVLVVALLATYRLSLLFTHDTLTEGAVDRTVKALNRRKHPDARDRANPLVHEDVLLRRAADPHPLVKLINCPWCVSFWLGLAVVASGWAYGDRWWWFIPAGALSASAVAGALTDLAHPEGRTDEVP